MDQLGGTLFFKARNPSRGGFHMSASPRHRTDHIAMSVLVAQLCPTLLARQAPLPMGSPRQEYWSGLPFPSPGDLPDPGVEPGSPMLRADSSPPELPEEQYRMTDHIAVDLLKSPSLGGPVCHPFPVLLVLPSPHPPHYHRPGLREGRLELALRRICIPSSL